MRIEQHQTSVGSVPAWAIHAHRARLARAVLVTVLIVASVEALAPGSSEAHEDGAPGLGGAESTSAAMVTRRSGDSASNRVWTSPARASCLWPSPRSSSASQARPTSGPSVQRFGAAPTDLMGNFGPTPIPPGTGGVLHPDGSLTACSEAFNARQCSMVAATFDPVTDQPTHMAEHYVCQNSGPCEPKPTGSWSTTTTTAPPPKSAQLAMGEDGYPPGERLTGTGQGNFVYTSPINVSGRGFLPSAVVEISECGQREGTLVCLLPRRCDHHRRERHGPRGGVHRLGDPPVVPHYGLRECPLPGAGPRPVLSDSSHLRPGP